MTTTDTPAAANGANDAVIEVHNDEKQIATPQDKNTAAVTADYFDEAGHFLLEKFAVDVRENLRRHGVRPRRLGVAWRNLTVQGLGSGYTAQSTVSSALGAPLDIIRNPSHVLHRRPAVKTILDNVSGVLQPGEMLLVLGRPGAGCSTMLKMLASYRQGFHAVTGDIRYSGGLSHEDIQGPLRGDVVFAPEDDVHFPTLTVLQTLRFATETRAPQAGVRPAMQTSDDEETHTQSRDEYSRLMVEVLARVLGVQHTFNTKVGNDVIRGVSGGERKRVTVAEALASRSRLALFDNSSRGLDSSTALEFVRALRIGADTFHTTIAASLYQAGDNITRLFDKVLVLNNGRQAYFGPVSDAVAYFERLGFKQQHRQTIADFLVACASGEQNAAVAAQPSVGLPPPPISADAQRSAWRASPEDAELQRQLSTELDAPPSSSDRELYLAITRAEKASTARATSKYTISFPMQVGLALRRRAQITMGDLSTQIVPVLAGIFQALIIGSVYVQMPNNTDNLFSRGGVLFTALLYNGLTAMSEITRGYAQRPIVIRHKQFAYLHPTADALADALLDIPLRLINITTFSIILYFMTGLATTADQFFIFFGTVALTCYTMVAFFRMLAALFKDESRATMLAGLAVIDMVLYTGYAIPRPTMRVWWKWLSYCNPLSFSFEILITNEFRRLQSACTTLIPAGPAYANVATANQVCPIAGAQPGQMFINGADYVATSYGYSFANSRRNVGILFGFWFFFLIVYVLASEQQTDPLASGSVTIFKQGSSVAKRIDEVATSADDVEKAVVTGAEASIEDDEKPSNEKQAQSPPSPPRPTVSWRDVCYDVQIKTETRRLLQNVSGFVKPGTMTALMGTSGAGKTTLLNVLAQRTDTGVVKGQFMVNGAPIPRTFQADTGYCQQQDIHLDTQTVREALQFSALLRQPAHVPREEKLAYVQEVLDLLEMNAFADAVVGHVGEGLNLEQRKLLTVGVELAAKPKLLLFLDEPTSGLDSMAAWSIVRLLRKLAAAGQAILCTIHQPSGELFNEFDSLLLLQKGGRTVYFGETGNNSNKLIEYFEHTSGQSCASDANPAEYILDVLGSSSDKVDWHQAFLASTLKTDLDAHLAELDGLATEKHHPSDDETGRHASSNEATEYAAPMRVQFAESLKRIFSHYHRSTTYIASKCLLNVIAGLFIGSSFWGRGADNSTSSLQNKVFAIFMSLVLATSLAQQMQPMFIQLRSLYEARERPSKMYSWPVAVLSLVLVEVPWNVLGGTLFWASWYWMVGFAPGKTAAIVWGYYMLFQLFFGSLAQAIAALSPNSTIASVLFSSLFSFVIVFCGVLQPPSSMPYFWRAWMYHLSPFTYLIEGMLGPVLGGKPIRCQPEEFNTIVPPSGQSCDAFLGNFSISLDALNAAGDNVDSLAGTGYYVSNTADGTCGFCAYRTGDDYLQSAGYSASQYGRNFGIIVAYIVFNYALCLGCFYAFRIAKWNVSLPSFGTKKTTPRKKEKVKQVAGTTATTTSERRQDEDAASDLDSDSDSDSLAVAHENQLTRALSALSAQSQGVSRPSGRTRAGSQLPVANPFGLSQIMPQRADN